MTDIRKFAILRLIPDEARGEIINIGLIVFHPSGVDVRVQPSAQKIRAVNPNAKVDALYALPEGLGKLLERLDSDDAKHNMLRHFPLVDVSELGEMSYGPGQYEDRVLGLLDRLVKTPPMTQPRERVERLERELRTAFSANNLLGGSVDDINRHRVVPKFPIAPSEDLYADFALKNGSMHVTAVVDFRVDHRSIRQAKKGQAAIKAITLDCASKRFSSCVPLAVYAANDSDRGMIEPQIALLQDYASRVFDFRSADDRSAYMEHMVAAAYS